MIFDTPLPLLHLFIISVFIQVQADIRESDLFPDASFHSLLSSEAKRLCLIAKLLIVLRVAGRINSHYFCLQLIVMCYTLLAPLIQENKINEFVMKVRLIAYCVVINNL